MGDLEILALMEARLAEKLMPMSQVKRIAFLLDLFGRRGIEIYERLVMRYPELVA